jgi:hypothetical protein
MKELGEFNFKVTSTTCQLNEQQLVQLQINVQGQTPDGQVVATLSVSPGKVGQFSVVGVNYQDSGNIITARGQGQYESIGQGKQHRWRTNTTILTSDGRRLRSDGEFDQQSQTWKGRTYSLDE